MSTVTPSVYVGTYHKYNSGSLFGKWVELNDFDNADEFYQACTALHWDETTPELMFQDSEGIPGQFVNECGINPSYWDYLEVLKSSFLDADVFAAAFDLEIPVDMVEELYQGQHDSHEDFAYQLADDMGMVPEGNDWPTSYIDWQRAARDLMFDYGESGGHYFRTSY